MPGELDEGDDLLKSLGLSAAPIDSNDLFFQEITNGKYTKIDNMIYWMKDEIAKWLFLQSHNTQITKNVVSNGKPFVRTLTRMEYSKLMLKYYLQQYHLPRFSKEVFATPCDYDTVIGKIVTYERMKKVIDEYGG